MEQMKVSSWLGELENVHRVKGYAIVIQSDDKKSQAKIFQYKAIKTQSHTSLPLHQ